MGDNFVQKVTDVLARHNLSPSRLELEITEEALIYSVEEALEVITPLEKMGIHFSIDDFGTGQTSLRYLNKFPVTTMKMDRSFIRNIGKNERATEITRSIIAMGARLGYTVVAEGVEDQQQLDVLKEWNCPLVQGYLFSKPVSESNVLAMLETNGYQELKKAS
jgi:EAL domain-containing protein (putative c-di-GMP-specific phosphodiesterase class I)